METFAYMPLAFLSRCSGSDRDCPCPLRAGPTGLRPRLRLEDIDSKISKVERTARAETCRQMIEVISKDGSVPESDKQLLAQNLRELTGA